MVAGSSPAGPTTFAIPCSSVQLRYTAGTRTYEKRIAMPTITKTDSGSWKAIIHKTGWPTTIKTFRLKKDAEDWARRTEDEMVRGVHIQRTPSERMTLAQAPRRSHTYQKSVHAKRRNHQGQAATSRARQIRIGCVDAGFGCGLSRCTIGARKVEQHRPPRTYIARASLHSSDQRMANWPSIESDTIGS